MMLRRLFGWSWRISIAAIILVFSSFGVINLISGAGILVANQLIERVTGWQPAVARGLSELDDLKIENGKLKSRLAVGEEKLERSEEKLADAKKLVSRKNQAISNLKSELARRPEAPGKGIVNYRQKDVTLKNAVADTNERLAERSNKMARREVSGMAAEAVPYVGAAAIVGLTALEVSDLCEMMRDMNELHYSLEPGARPSREEPTVCSIKVPTRSVIWANAKEAPGKAFDAVKGGVPELESVANLDASDLWSFGLWIVETATTTWQAGQQKAELTAGNLWDLWNDWNR